MFLILDPKLRKFEISEETTKLTDFFACQTVHGLSYYIFIYVSDRHENYKYVV